MQPALGVTSLLAGDFYEPQLPGYGDEEQQVFMPYDGYAMAEAHAVVSQPSICSLCTAHAHMVVHMRHARAWSLSVMQCQAVHYETQRTSQAHHTLCFSCLREVTTDKHCDARTALDFRSMTQTDSN